MTEDGDVFILDLLDDTLDNVTIDGFLMRIIGRNNIFLSHLLPRVGPRGSNWYLSLQGL